MIGYFDRTNTTSRAAVTPDPAQPVPSSRMEPKDTHQTKRLSAGVAVVHCRSGEFLYLLLRSYRNWDFPKGMVEPNELPLAAAIREVTEETGLSSLEFRWGETYIETDPYAGGKVARYYVALSPAPDVTLG